MTELSVDEGAPGAEPAASRRPAGYRAALHIRDFRLLISGLTVSEIGSWAYNVGLAVFVFERTGSPAWVAAASLTRFLTALVVSPYAGVVAERFERVRLMVLTDSAAFVFMTLLAVAAAVKAPVPLALVFAGLTSICAALYLPAVKATTPSIVGEDGLAAANSLESTIDNLAIVAGPAIGAGLLLLGPPALAFALNAATFAYSAFIVSRIRTRSVPTDVTEGGAAGPIKQMRVGVETIFESRTVAILVLFSVLASLVYGTDTVLYVVISNNLLGTGSDGYGYLLASSAIGGVVVASFMNRIAAAPRLGSLIALGMFVYCAPTAVYGLVHVPGVIISLQLVRGAGTVVVDVLAMTAMQRLVPRDRLARVIGAFFALVLAAIAVGTILAPLLLSALGLTGALLVMGTVIPGLVILLYPQLRGIDTAGMEELARIAPIVALLQRLDIFATASRPTLERLAIACVEETVDAGTVLIREGDPADDFYVLVSGEVKISSSGEAQARRRSLGRLVAPAYFGEIGLLARVPRTATVTATQPCNVYRIDGDEFLDAMTAEPLSPSALGLAQVRLSRTHPSYAMSLSSAAAGVSAGGGAEPAQPAVPDS